MANIREIQAGKASVSIEASLDKLDENLAEAKRRVASATEKLADAQRQVMAASEKGDKKAVAASLKIQNELNREIKLYSEIERSIKKAESASVSRGEASGSGSGAGWGRMKGIPSGVGILGGAWAAGRGVKMIGDAADAAARGDNEALVKSIPVIGDVMTGLGGLIGAVSGATTAMIEFKKAQEAASKVVDLNKQRFGLKNNLTSELARMGMTADERAKDDAEKAYKETIKQIEVMAEQYRMIGGTNAANAARSLQAEKELATAIRDRKIAEIDAAAAAKSAADASMAAQRDAAAVSAAMDEFQSTEIAGISDKFQRREAEINAAYERAVANLQSSNISDAAKEQAAAIMEQTRALKLQGVDDDRKKQADDELARATADAAKVLERQTEEQRRNQERFSSWVDQQIEAIKTNEQKIQEYNEKIAEAMNRGLLKSDQADTLMEKFAKNFETPDPVERARSDSRGTFNAAAIQGLQSGPVQERIAKATEETAKQARQAKEAIQQSGQVYT